eukprot:CAMPEP_0180748514 /NCGR_PEP_ID=MMETSP1038_2-20121128/30097_1 /TAXON_ID=632150 /ORGANISM="Azadinium spinosum, Strain 3D9" /LENGTH=46 /DNA_ID= /DNA_START= /DNA_END= /DNA_ORIENTATION=
MANSALEVVYDASGGSASMRPSFFVYYVRDQQSALPPRYYDSARPS